MSKITIGCCGFGFVGKAVSLGFFQVGGFDVLVYDPFMTIGKNLMFHREQVNPDDRISHLTQESLEEVVNKSQIIFVCVPTPMFEDGSSDTSIVESVCDTIDGIADKIQKDVVVVIKSTVVPGTSKKIQEKMKKVRIAFNPEFLREETFLQDFLEQDRVVIGSNDLDTLEVVKKIYEIFVYQRSMKYPYDSSLMTARPKYNLFKDTTSAEMVKYITNCFLATKISFANEMYQICEKLEIDYKETVEAATFDNRLGKEYGWTVPGTVLVEDEPALGFGLSCLPGSTIISMSDEKNLTIQDLSNDWLINQTFTNEFSQLKVKSFDTQIADVEVKEVKSVTTREHDGLLYTFTIEVDGVERSLSCTPEHIMPIYRDEKLLLVMAKDILDNDELFYV